MSLLSLEHVSKHRRENNREHAVLRDVTLQIETGELIAVWGTRRSGRTTLLRIAAGVEQPDSGHVHFEGLDLAQHGERSLGTGIGYVAKTLRAGEEQSVREQVAAALLARGTPADEARQRARAALCAVSAEQCSAMRVSELSAGEGMRVALARSLVLFPSLLVIDEPTATVELSERDGILALLRELAGNGTAVLASSGSPEELAGFHRVLTLSEGVLRGETGPGLAPVVALRGRGM